MKRITCQVYFTEKRSDGSYRPKTKKPYFYNFPIDLAIMGCVVDIKAASSSAKEMGYSNPVMIAAVLDKEYGYIDTYTERPCDEPGREIKHITDYTIMNPEATAKVIAADLEKMSLQNKIKNNYGKESENDTMNKNMFGMNFEFGKVPSGKFKMSFYGLAFATGEGRYAIYDASENEFTDVTEMTLDFGDMIYQMPCAAKDVAIGDIIKHKGTYVIVAEATEQGDIVAIDPFKSEKITLVPTKNMFGFNFVTKVINIAGNMFGDTKPDADNPFGNMMPFMMMSAMNDGGDDNGFMKAMLMMNMMGNGSGAMDFSKNPMAMMMFMNGFNK
jgi:hypothetical protein